ncbi:MAG: hypothetical protein HY318_00995, partial [Armatimonadetes bacterium]|nr:hypothetical protein [Armatimonadota bacterium]
VGLAWALMLCLLFGISPIEPVCLGDVSPAEWNQSDREAMRQAVILVWRKKYHEAMECLLPVYKKSPYRSETFYAPKDLPPDFLPEGVPCQHTPIELLSIAMQRMGEYSKAFAMGSAMHFHNDGTSMRFSESSYLGMPHIRREILMRPSPAVAVNDLWIDFAPEPLFRDGSVFVPVEPLADVLHLKLIWKKPRNAFVLRREKPLQEWGIEVGKKEVTVSSHEKLLLKDAPFHYRDSLMISMYDVVTLLEGCFHWYPAARVLHATFAVPN